MKMFHRLAQKTVLIATTALLGALMTATAARAQEQVGQPVYSTPQAYTPPEYATPSGTTPVYQAAPARTSIRDLFAGTLATVAHATGSTLVVGLTQAIAGGLTGWFNRKAGGQPVAAGYPPAYSAAPAMPTYTTPGYSGYAQESSPAQTAYQPPAYNADPYAGGELPQYFDPRTGLATTSQSDFGMTTAGAPSVDSGLYAGLAYEVHAIDANGQAVAVNPATHEFRTGDRFLLHYRPALPGRMDVFNINAAGRRTQIDSVELAAGQLATLGPYEFAALTGDEVLQLVLTPCSTPALLAVTRDIVKVSDTPVTGPGLGLASCGPVTRSAAGVVTRDIRKVALDGMTGFALDPVSAEERASGQLAPREVSVAFRHR